MISGRFWAPQRPTTQPDAVVLALLDPEVGDLGTRVLALHRAGAAACEVVAKGALPSEAGLVRALAEARHAVAGSVVTALSKSMTPTYAGLLVRDLFDDAEQGALDLFRTAVAKGVPPPIAASRVGAVFGLPMKAMGHYTPLAIDAKANPLALTDAADRALLSYVAQVGAEESQEVAKAGDDHAGATAEWDDTEHPRDKLGRFDFSDEEVRPKLSPLDRIRANLGIQHAVPKVDGAPEQAEAEKPVVQRVTRQTRQTRQTRKVRMVRTASAPRQAEPLAAGPALAGSAKLSSPQLGSQSLSQGALSRATLKARSNELQSAGRLSGLTGPALPDIPFRPPEQLPSSFMRRFNSTDSSGYPVTGESLAIAMSSDNLSALLPNFVMSRNDSKISLFRMGHLRDQGHAPDLVDSAGNLHRAQVFDDSLDGQIAEQRALLGIDPEDKAEVEVLDHPEMDLAKQINLAKKKLVGNDHGEAVHMFVAQDYHRPDLDLLVYTPPGVSDNGRPSDDDEDWDASDDRPLATVAVLSINGPVRVVNNGSDNRPDWRIDPNQAFRFNRANPTMLYDTQRGAVVMVYDVIAMDDDEIDFDMPSGVSKANELEGAALAEFNERVHRDSLGQFAVDDQEGATRMSRLDRIRASLTEETAEEAPAARVARTTRTTRQLRTTRQVRATRAQQAQTLGALSSGAQLSRQQLDQAQLSRSELAAQSVSQQAISGEGNKLSGFDQDIQLSILHDDSEYRVLTMGDFHDMVGVRGVPGDATITLTQEQTDELNSQMGFAPEVVTDLISFNLKQEIDYNEGPVMTGTKVNRRLLAEVPNHSVKDDASLEKTVNDTLHNDAQAVMLYVVHSLGSVKIYGSTKSVDRQIIIESDKHLDPYRPIRLVPIGDFDSEQLAISRIEVNGYLGKAPDLNQPFNAPVRRYRAESVPDPND